MTAGIRTVGDVYVKSSTDAPVYVFDSNTRAYTAVSVNATTSATVVIISANTTGAIDYTITNLGSLNVYIEGSFNGSFFHPSVAVVKMVDNASINSISASTAASFRGLYQVVRVVAQSASGVWRAALTYR